jgi:ankyrin repeat protein
MLKSIDPRNKMQAYRILTWVALSKKPLSPSQLAEAAVIDPRADTPFEPSKRLRRLEETPGLLKLIPSLLIAVTTKDDETEIRFSHFSVQEFLFSTDKTRLETVSQYQLRKDEGNILIAESCLCYHIYASQIKDIAITDENDTETFRSFPLWEYAARYWMDHMEVVMEHAWTQTLEKRAAFVLTPQTKIFLIMIQIFNPAQEAHKANRNWGITLDELAHPLFYLSAFGNPKLLTFAVKCLDTEVVKKLINVEYKAYPGTALQAAMRSRDIRMAYSMASLLLEHGAEVNFQGGEWGNALQAAAWIGSEEVVSLFLKQGADVNARGGRLGNALQAAAEKGSEAVVSLLLAQGADVNAQGGVYGNALQAAVAWGSEAVISLLLAQGADVNARGGYYGNTLQAAAAKGSTAVVSLLLAQGADINAQGGAYGNALQAAAAEGSEAAASLLLARGADVNARGGYYGNSLQAAAGKGSAAVVSLLLAQGADINARGGRFGNALQAAAADGSEAVVSLLLAQGADVNARGGMFGNALQAAVEKGHENIVKLLLQHGVEERKP